MKKKFVITVHTPFDQKFKSEPISDISEEQVERLVDDAVKGKLDKVALKGKNGEWFFFGEKVLTESVISYKKVSSWL